MLPQWKLNRGQKFPCGFAPSLNFFTQSSRTAATAVPAPHVGCRFHARRLDKNEIDPAVFAKAGLYVADRLPQTHELTRDVSSQ
jgi:hypothetical protein